MAALAERNVVVFYGAACVRGPSMMFSLLVGTLFQLAGVHAPTVDQSTMVEISAGTYVRGTSTENAVGRYGDGWYINEQPAHEVSLNTFSIDRTEITNAHFALFLTWSCGDVCFDERMDIHRSTDGFRAAEGYENHPVNWIEWSHADWYCRWAGKRLPTEAEWEYAAQGMDDRPWPWDRDGGPECSSTPYSFDGGRCPGETISILDGISSQTNDGISGMGGNVAEWVSDWSSPYGLEALSDPQGPPTGRMKIVRGGGFLSNRLEMKPRARRDAHPRTRAPDIGFRCAWDETLTDPVGLLRGELPTATGQLMDPHPREPFNSKSTIALEGLVNPGALIAVGGALYVSHAAGVTIRNRDGSRMDHPEPRVTEWLTDGIGVFGVDPEAEIIWRIDEVEAVAVHECPGISSAYIDEHVLLWTDGERIVMIGEEDESANLVESGADINTMTTWDGRLWWTEKNGPKLMSVELEGGTPQQHFGPPDIRNPLVLGLGSANDEGELPVTVALQSWPYSGLICRYSTHRGRLNCRSHGPPKAEGIRFYEDQLVWATQFGVVTLGSRAPYEFVSDLVQPGGFTIEANRIWITDRRGGRVLAMELNEQEEN